MLCTPTVSVKQHPGPRARNFSSYCLDDGISAKFVGVQQDMALVKETKVQLLYISPEALLQNCQWREMLLSQPYRENLVAIAVDEAHCIVRW